MLNLIVQLVCWIVLIVVFVLEARLLNKVLDENSELLRENGELKLANQINKQSIDFINTLLEDEDDEPEHIVPNKTADYKEQILRMRAEGKTLHEISLATGCSDSAISKAIKKWSIKS